MPGTDVWLGRAQVQGALAQACQASTNGDCVAVCVEGGPVTRVEHLLMDAIVKNVHVRGKDDVSVSARSKSSASRLTSCGMRSRRSSRACPARSDKHPVSF